MLKFNVTTGQFDYIRSIAWLDGRFVNTSGDTMTGSLGMPSESYIGPTSTNGIYFKSGNIGIGTTNPIQKLDLNGKLAINGSVQIYNASSLDGFIGSVFFGDGGTFLSHSSGDQGYYNFGIGSGALYSNTTGLMNTGIGSGALFTNTIGEQNFALGFHSMYKNISGQQNLGIGSYSLEANTTGSYNLAIGNVSSFYNTTGIGNVSIGYDSGSFNKDWGTMTNNNYCVYIGYDSKGSASGNTNEIAIGFNVDGNGSNSVTLGNSSIVANYFTGQMVLNGIASAPTGIEGGIYFNSTDKHFYGYNGTSFVQLDN